MKNYLLHFYILFYKRINGNFISNLISFQQDMALPSDVGQGEI